MECLWPSKSSVASSQALQAAHRSRHAAAVHRIPAHLRSGAVRHDGSSLGSRTPRVTCLGRGDTSMPQVPRARRLPSATCSCAPRGSRVHSRAPTAGCPTLRLARAPPSTKAHDDCDRIATDEHHPRFVASCGRIATPVVPPLVTSAARRRIMCWRAYSSHTASPRNVYASATAGPRSEEGRGKLRESGVRGEAGSGAARTGSAACRIAFLARLLPSSSLISFFAPRDRGGSCVAREGSGVSSKPSRAGAYRCARVSHKYMISYHI